MTPREKIVRLLLRIIAHPYQFTRKQLADHIGMSKDAVNECIDVFKIVGLNFHQDKPQYRCAILPEKGFKELERLQPLSENDRNKIAYALGRINDKERLFIMNKLESLYDFQKLGIRALRRPELEKIDKLKSAKRRKLKVVLENYRSNSNEIKDRIVECFDIDTEAGMIQVLEIKDSKPRPRHFKLSRIERIRILENQSWEYEEKHYKQHTDVFRIANNNREPVHLVLDVYAYNALIDTFPQAQKGILSGAEKNTFDFQTEVNANFLGITNFIMSNIGHVEILYPNELKAAIRVKAQEILKGI